MASKPSKEYWIERSIQREQESYLFGIELDKRLFREYDRATRALRKTIREFYAKYGKKHDLAYEDVVKMLSAKELQEWKKTLEEYMAELNAATDPKVRETLIAQLDALSTNSQISRLEALIADTRAQLDQLYDRCRQEILSDSRDTATVTQKERSGSPDPATTTSTYPVSSGDSLWAIAKRHYGDGAKWKAIYEANKSTIGANPNLIYPGQVLTLP